MHLSRKGATNGIPIWLLAVTIGLVIFRVALWAGHSQQVSLKFVNWRPYTELSTIARAQDKPILLYFVGDGSPKTQMMEDIVFSNRMVAECILNEFYPVIVPGANQFEGEARSSIRKLYKKYLVVQVPSLVVVSPAGTEVAHTNGFKPSAQTYQFLKTVKDGPRIKEIEESDKIPEKHIDQSENPHSDEVEVQHPVGKSILGF
ncbi:hypothetical protein BH10CYA1_BH10CYA1_30920 [soil metagenome]